MTEIFVNAFKDAPAANGSVEVESPNTKEAQSISIKAGTYYKNA